MQKLFQSLDLTALVNYSSNALFSPEKKDKLHMQWPRPRCSEASSLSFLCSRCNAHWEEVAFSRSRPAHPLGRFRVTSQLKIQVWSCVRGFGLISYEPNLHANNHPIARTPHSNLQVPESTESDWGQSLANGHMAGGTLAMTPTFPTYQMTTERPRSNDQWNIQHIKLTSLALRRSVSGSASGALAPVRGN